MLRAYNGQLYANGRSLPRRLSRVAKNSVVRVTCDMDAGTIAYSINDKDEGIAFTGVKGTVHPAVAFYGSGRTVTLMRVDAVTKTGGGQRLPQPREAVLRDHGVGREGALG